jgi:hypothetical protein
MSKTIKDIYFLSVLLFSGLSTAFFRSHEGLIILWAVGLVIFAKETIRPNKVLFIALGVWLGYFVINTFIIQSFHPFFMGTYIAKIMIAYWLLSYYREKIFLKYENTIYAFAIISLLFYVIHIYEPARMYDFLKSFDLSQDLFPKSYYASIVFYTFNHRYSLYEDFPRNAGFTWEPGPFSCFIALAIFFNLARNGLQFNDKSRIGILLLTLITTQSTTGFVAMLCIIVWYAWARFKNKYVHVLSVSLVLGLVIVLFTSVPILQEKIISESQENMDEIIERSIKYGGSYAPGRFASFQLGWEDFKAYPIAGTGGNTELRYGLAYGAEVHAINGLANIMARYGAIGLLIFLSLLFYTGKWFARHYQYQGYFIFPTIILITSFGFGIVEQPIIFAFLLVPVFLKQYDNKSKINA